MSLSIILSFLLYSLGVLDWVHVVESVEVLAHDQSLSPLLSNLLLGERFQKDWDDNGVAESPVLPGWEDSRSSNIGEVTLLDVEHVESCEEGSEEGRSSEHSLRVVHSIDDGLVLLPLVIIHI
jgi:hypothetical protein